jgi:hypothetical protein
MHNKILFGVLAVVGVCFVVGCSSPDAAAPSSAAEKKNFAGGPMPPEARKQFEESQKQGQANLADRIEKAKADAMAGKK